MARDTGNRPTLTRPEAAAFLGLSVDAVDALAQARFLEPVSSPGEGAKFPLVDLKAFLARNADYGSGNLLGIESGDVDPQALLEALDGRSDEMARRAFEIFSAVFPEATRWSLRDQAQFVDQARHRFEAILAVTAQGAEVDEALIEDLHEVGAATAGDGSPLPQLLVTLRISRDLVVQTAVELAEEQGRHWGLALSLLLTRVLPAVDRLVDALAQGYWATVVRREEENRARYEHLVEHSSDGIYEVDGDGVIRYANASLAVILGRRVDQLEGGPLVDALTPLSAATSLDLLVTEPEGDAERVEMTVVRHDGVRRVLDIRSLARKVDGEPVGFQGVVRDVTTAHDLEEDKNTFLSLVTNDLRTPLTVILGLGATLESHSEELSGERIRRMGSAIRGQAERMSRLADDLSDMAKLEAHTLLLSSRPLQLRRVVDAALDSVADADGVEIRISDDVTVLADARRLEQVVANLVENAVLHGAAPIVVEVVGQDEAEVHILVSDGGAGVSPLLVPTLFSRLRTLNRSNRDRSRGTGLGLSLVKGLVEAMGGRVWYGEQPAGGAGLHFTLPMPRRRVDGEAP